MESIEKRRNEFAVYAAGLSPKCAGGFPVNVQNTDQSDGTASGSSSTDIRPFEKSLRSVDSTLKCTYCDYVFLAWKISLGVRNPNPFRGRLLSRCSTCRILVRLAVLKLIPSPHLLRHNVALVYIGNDGGDSFSLQRILGYRDQTTTSKYVNMARSNVKAQHSKYSLGERL